MEVKVEMEVFKKILKLKNMNFFNKLYRKVHEETNVLLINIYKIYSILSYKKIINKNINQKGTILIEGMWDNPHHWLRTIIIRNAIAEKYGSKILGVYYDKTKLTTYLILKALTNNNLFKFKKNSKKKNKYIEKSRQHLKTVKNIKELINSRINYNFPVFYFYDGFCKKFDLATCGLDTKGLDLELAKCMELLDYYNNFFNNQKIDAAILSHIVTIRYSCMAWILLTKKIPIFFTQYTNDHIVIKKLSSVEDMLNPKDDAPNISELRKVDENKKINLIKIGEEYIKNNRNGTTDQMSIFKTYKKKNPYYVDKIDFLKKNKFHIEKPLVVIMAPCFVDFPNYYGPNWYSDYFELMEFTLKTISKIDSCNWSLKPHPAENRLGKNTLKELFPEDKISNNIRYWPTDATSTEVFEFADLLITARGSSGLLYGVEKKKVLAAVSSAYTDFKVCEAVNNKEDYRESLNNINELINKEFDFSDTNIAKMFLAISLAEDKTKLSFPYGFFSQELYKTINKFIKNNNKKIENEIKKIKLWERSGSDRYNTYIKLQTLI